MSGSINEKEEPNPSASAQEAVIDEGEDAMKRLRISPRKILGSLSHLRIDRARIKPIEGQAPKAGGKADVEAALLASPPSSSPSGSNGAEYVAVKKLRFDEDTDDDRTLAPLAHEVGLLNDLSHENVVKMVGFVEAVKQGVGWLVFAWEKNGNLREFIRSTEWELPERVSLINDVAMGLSYLHGRDPPICHGDLKSLNILVNSGNRAVITDFGSARTVGSEEEGAVKGVPVAKAATTPHPTAMRIQKAESEALTAEISPSGEFITITGPAWTMRWASPELLEGDLPGLASDIWAMGWICWEVVTGNFPFDKENDVSVVLRITKGDLPAIENDNQLKQIKDQTVPSHREGSSSSVTRSSGLFYALGWVQLRNDMYPEARKYFEQSRQVAESVGDEEGIAMAYKAIGDTSYLRGEYSEAEESYIRARDIYSQIGERQGFAQSVGGLGDVYRMRGEYSKAEESYIRARDIYSETGNQVGFAQSVDSLGDVYRMQSAYSKAEESYIRARDIYSQIGNQLGFAQSVKSLGDVYQLRGESSEAEESYIRARDIYSRIGDQLGFAQSVRGLGDVYRMRGEHSEAEESYIRAREIYSQVGNQLGFAQSVKSLGDAYHMRGEYSKAEESYIHARDIYSQIGDQLGVAQSSEGIGRVHSAQGAYAMAEKSYSEAQRVYRQLGYMHGLANISWFLGWLYRDRAQYAAAERLVREASTIYGGLGLEQDVEECNQFIEEIRRITSE